MEVDFELFLPVESSDDVGGDPGIPELSASADNIIIPLGSDNVNLTGTWPRPVGGQTGQQDNAYMGNKRLHLCTKNNESKSCDREGRCRKSQGCG